MRYTWENRSTNKNLPSETYHLKLQHLNTLGNYLFPILIHRLVTGCSIPYLKTWGSPTTPPPPPPPLQPQFILLKTS